MTTNSPTLRPEPDPPCTQCGQSGAYAFDGGPLCADCTHERASCCADEEECLMSEAGLANPNTAQLRLNPNCCYEACPSCSSVRRLREFQARHPHDWESRLVGSERLVRAARQRT